jgi:hypothetical protein
VGPEAPLPRRWNGLKRLLLWLRRLGTAVLVFVVGGAAAIVFVVGIVHITGLSEYFGREDNCLDLGGVWIDEIDECLYQDDFAKYRRCRRLHRDWGFRERRCTNGPGGVISP